MHQIHYRALRDIGSAKLNSGPQQIGRPFYDKCMFRLSVVLATGQAVGSFKSVPNQRHSKFTQLSVERIWTSFVYHVYALNSGQATDKIHVIL